MPKIRYKTSPEDIRTCSAFNMHAMAEVLTGDDSAFVSSLDVFLEAKQEWKDMSQAFKDHDLITDNYNSYFFEPKNEEDRKRGYTE